MHTPDENRGRPRTFNEIDVLNLSIPVFLKHGYFGISISELLKAIDMERSSFYLAFGDKEAFYCQVLNHYHDNAFSQMKGFLDKEADCIKAFDLVIDFFYDNSTRDQFSYGCLTANAATEITEKHSKINSTVQTLRTMMTKLFSDRLKRGISDGDIRSDIDHIASAEFLKCCLDGMAIHARGHRDVESTSHIKQNIRQLTRSWAT